MNFENSLLKLKNTIIENWNSLIEMIPKIIVSILIITVGFLLSKFIANAFKKTISKRTHDELMTNFLSRTLKLGILALVIMLALKIAGLQSIATGLLAAVGASTVIIGFAFKDIGENFISGVILSFKRPFDINDTVKVDDIFGKVKGLEFRYTKLKTFDGRDVYIPNSDIIKKAVYNYTEDGYYRNDFMVGIDYDDSIDIAKKLILKAVIGTLGVIDTEEHKCFVTVDNLGVSTVNLKVIFWTKTKEYKRGALETKSEVIKNVKNIISKNGISMPADIKELKLHNSQKSIPITIEDTTK
ncbi:mechanosensitive ion channel family protein [Tenacibaculum sp. M341]|uniref:mechanosensitive ion channel family protein n=1 Tax=Tenacibaculum sp. M341 TaxID=2530339 RepID=UPI001046AF27|nr:mechanosensitive ion channel [Tenacibaculum sp. M341]TCI93645.1 mechanosensitive ion channel [Tenacibaculum sp. M341]